MLLLPLLLELSLDVLRDLLLDRDEGGRLPAVAPVSRQVLADFETGVVIGSIYKKLDKEVCRECRVCP